MAKGTKKKRKATKKKRQRGRMRRFALCALAAVAVLSLALVLPWRWLPPPTSAFMLQHRGPVQQRWVAMAQIAPALPIAVVAAEDQRFPEHHGFDFDSISKALREDRSKLRGASTITQQLAKNLFLWPGRSIVRKALEAYFTVLLELTWPKQRILEVYLNIVEFGPGIYGAEAASHSFFHRPARRLSTAQAALLAAVLPNPKRFSAQRPSAYVRQRAAHISQQVRALGGSGYLLWL
jgi:monofunctional biosynthetic peptidoglycan transglycosylase